MRILSALAAAALAVSGSSAAAEPYDTTELFARGVWTVEHAYDSSDGTSWCSADSVNAAGQSMSVVAYDSGAVALLVADTRWRLAQRDVAFAVAIDGTVWTAGGYAEDYFVFAPVEGDGGASFLRELMQGAAVAISNDAGRELAAFSLDGSRQALLVLMECWSRIDANDPFTRASDPF